MVKQGSDLDKQMKPLSKALESYPPLERKVTEDAISYVLGNYAQCEKALSALDNFLAARRLTSSSKKEEK